MRFLTTPDLWRIKFGKIQKFSVALKIWLEMESLTTRSWPAKDEILQNQEKFWFVLKIWLKNAIFDHCRPAKDEILQNQEILICVKN